MRIFFATDIHGANRVFIKFLNSLKVFKADVGILGGDIMGKRLTPTVKGNDGDYTLQYQGRSQKVLASRANDELIQMESVLDHTGFYTYRTTSDEMVKLQNDSAYLDSIFEKVMLNRLDHWIKLAEKKLTGTNVKVFVSGGNDDLPVIDSFLRRPGPFVYCESDVIDIGQDHELLSSGYGNITPWKCPRDISEEELEEKLESTISKVHNVSRSVFNIHVPPINTALDECPKLDTSVDPPRIMIGRTTHAGSIAVRNVISKYQPLLSLHGHIHESRGVEKIGKTLCINPGSEYSDGVLRGVFVNLENDKVKGFQMVDV